MVSADRHPRRCLHRDQTLGERAAGAIAGFLGSWRYLIIQTVVVLCWLVLNAVLLGRHPFDPYPFIALNLLFSTQASYAAPLLQLSANRIQHLDRKRDDLEAEEVARELEMLSEMQQMQQELLELQRTQMKILTLLQEQQT